MNPASLTMETSCVEFFAALEVFGFVFALDSFHSLDKLNIYYIAGDGMYETKLTMPNNCIRYHNRNTGA